MNLTEQNLSDLVTTTYSVLICLSAFWGLNGPYQCTVEASPQIFQKIRMTWYLSLLPCLESALFKHVISHKISRFRYSWHWGTVSSPYRPGEIIMIKVGRRRGIQKRQFSSHPDHQIHVVMEKFNKKDPMPWFWNKVNGYQKIWSWEVENSKLLDRSQAPENSNDLTSSKFGLWLCSPNARSPARQPTILFSGITQLELLAYVRPWYISQNIYQLPIGHNYDPGPHRQN